MKVEIYERFDDKDVLIFMGNLQEDKIHPYAQKRRDAINAKNTMLSHKRKVISYLPNSIKNGELTRTIIIQNEPMSTEGPNSERHIMGW